MRYYLIESNVMTELADSFELQPNHCIAADPQEAMIRDVSEYSLQVTPLD